MITRPTAQSVGLTEAQFEALGELDYRRDLWRDRGTWIGTIVVVLCFAFWMLRPFKLQSLGTVVFLSILGSPFVAGIIYAAMGLFLRKPKQHEKLEAHRNEVLKFENTWRAQYWKSFWDAVSHLSYHVEPTTDLPRERLGFRYWNALDPRLFFVLEEKRCILHIPSKENELFELEAGHKAVNSLRFYCADMMYLISPGGFSNEVLEYLKDHSQQFRLQSGKEAIETAKYFNPATTKISPILLEVLQRLVVNTSLDLVVPTRAQVESALKKASEVVAAYGAVLEREGKPGILFHPESDLPYTKIEIRNSIELLLLTPCDDARRNNLEVVDMLLNTFVPDKEYSLVVQQRGGLSQALKNFYAGESDGRKLAKHVMDGATQGGETQLRSVEERVEREDLATLERHRELRREADRLSKR